MMESLMKSPKTWVILAIGTLIGIPAFIFSIYTWNKSKKKKRISIEKKSNRIVDKGKTAINKLRLFFDGKEVEDLTITRFAIWNSGNEAIRREDIASERKLRILNNGTARILDAKIVSEVESSNKFSILSISAKAVEIDFEYVDKNEGLIIQIIHTGSTTDLVVDCKIMGGEPIEVVTKDNTIENKFYNFMLRFVRTKVFVVLWVILLSFLTAFFALLLLTELGIINQENVKYERSPIWVTIIAAVLMISFLVFTIVSSIRSIKHIHKTYVPIEMRNQI